MPPEEPNTFNEEIEQALDEIERSLLALKERYNQVNRDRALQAELTLQADQLEQQATNRQEIKAELQRIQQELEAIELNLESKLFTWSTLKEPFWQAVRFGGIGIIVGWILKALAG